MDGLCDGSVDEVLNLSAREAWTHLGERFSHHVLSLGNLVQVQLEDVRSTVDVGVGHMDPTIKSTWSHCSWVKSFLMIGSADDQNIIVLIKAVHF